MAFGDCVAYGMDEAARIQAYLKKDTVKAPAAAAAAKPAAAAAPVTAAAAAVSQPKIPEGATTEPRTVIPQAAEGGVESGAAVPAAKAQ